MTIRNPEELWAAAALLAGWDVGEMLLAWVRGVGL